MMVFLDEEKVPLTARNSYSILYIEQFSIEEYCLIHRLMLVRSNSLASVIILFILVIRHGMNKILFTYIRMEGCSTEYDESLNMRLRIELSC